jgi:hypothetical protein
MPNEYMKSAESKHQASWSLVSMYSLQELIEIQKNIVMRGWKKI